MKQENTILKTQLAQAQRNSIDNWLREAQRDDNLVNGLRNFYENVYGYAFGKKPNRAKAEFNKELYFTSGIFEL